MGDIDRLLRTLDRPETIRFLEELPVYRGKINLRSMYGSFQNFSRTGVALAALKCQVEYLKLDLSRTQLNQRLRKHAG